MKTLKPILMILCALCLIACLALLAGCGATDRPEGGSVWENGSGGNGDHSGGNGDDTGNGGGGEDLPESVEVTLVFNGTPHTEAYRAGDVLYFALTYADMDVSLSADFSPLLGRDEGVTIREGLVIYLREKQQTPTTVTIAYYDVNTDGTPEPFERVDLQYGCTHTFDGAGFILYRDQACTQEIDPNEEFVLTENLSVYRKDNKDRTPIFVRVHYYINGIEYTGLSGNEIFFRGELLRDSTYILYDTEYTFYRDRGGAQPLFADGRVEVVRESDDTADWYAFNEDPNYHKVTFMIGERELGTVLMYHNDIIGQYAVTGIPGDSYIIRNCSAMDQAVTHDMTVYISEYDRISMFPVTEHLCYNGDIKFTIVNYNQVGGEYPMEIDEEDDYYTDVNCTQHFVGTVTTAKTFYRPLSVNLDRYVGNR